ncbi:MAG: hypothetical protein E4G91_02410 [Candidatus Zixiibacteriota bacterium]|nr:MAG: hypothetical protein E4G91_02410 [candidate division Zixibacteria bacterium]
MIALLRQVRYYQITLIIAAVLLVIWQVSIINSKKGGSSGAAATELSFTTNYGAEITLPDTTNKYTVVVFWKAASERSLQLVSEALSVCKKPEFDTLATLYLVNLFDSLPIARTAVDFDNPDLPFAHSPKGGFLDRNPIRSLPCTVIFAATGSVIEVIEGYQEGKLAEIVSRLEMLNRMTGKQGEFQFQFGGGERK